MTYYRQRTQGYKSLKSYQMSEIVFDATYKFCMRFLRKDWRTTDQMVQAARSGKQNIAEGCMGASVSGAFELKLICVARTSLEELLIDYHDFLRLRDLKIWNKYDEYAKEVRNLAYLSNRSYKTYKC